MAPTFNDVYRAKYLLLTTFTKDGRPKPTTVWGVPDGDKLVISTDDGSWKTKRINNTPRVTIQKCGVLGKPKGEPVEAVARNLPKSETRRVFDMVTRRYWWHAWWWVPQALLRGGVDKVHAAIEVQAGPVAPAPPAPRNPQRRPGVGRAWRCGCFLVYAVVELAVLVALASTIGFGWTVLLLARHLPGRPRTGRFPGYAGISPAAGPG